MSTRSTRSWLWYIVLLVVALLVPAALSAQGGGKSGEGGPPAGDSLGGGATTQAEECLEECGGGGYTVVVTPTSGAVTVAKNSGPHTAWFGIVNQSDNAATYTMQCSTLGGVSCVSAPTSVSLDAWDDTSVLVTYTVTTGGTLRYKALSPATATGQYTVTALDINLVTPAPTGTNRAVVHNRQPVIRALLSPNVGTMDSTGTVLKWDGENVTSLARFNRGVLEWEVDSTRRLSPGDSALVEVTACQTVFLVQKCATAKRYAVLLADSKPILGFTGAPLGSLSAGFGAPFGPGFSVSGAEVEAGLGTVPYYSMGAARSAGLVYSTRQSYPRALVPVDLELTWPAGTPSQIKLLLWDGGVKKDSLVLTSPTCATGAVRRCRAVLQADYASTTFATPTRKWLKVEAQITSGATTKSAVDSMEVSLVDRRTTWYGSGWWPSGVLKLVPAGGDRLLVSPSGGVTVFRGNGDSLYVGPPGSWSVLKKVAGGWELSPRGSTGKLSFDSYGRLRAAVDANGNADSLFYSGTTDQLTSLKDPVGKVITLTYDGSSKLSKLTTPGGRETKVSISASTNQLTYDSLSSSPSRPFTRTYAYQTYDATTKTVVMTRQIGVIADTTFVVYDSTFRRRPVQAKLPRVQNEAGSWVTPTIGYTAYERQGFGALRSLDSVYVEMKDPKNNWTRSLTNRWGQSRKTWDALGLLGRTEYSPEGLVHWSEGKNGDSSRVYSKYDGQLRLLKTFVVRASGDTLRGDSLVYDGNHRVVKTIDNRGEVDSVKYDANGNVLVTRDADGNETQYWYKANGQLDSLRLPGATKSRTVSYDGTWKNLRRSYNEIGQLLSENAFDSFGRQVSGMSKVRVIETADSTKWQWRRTLTYYTAANQVDSTLLQRTDNCNDPCNSPPAWPSASDAEKNRRVAVIFDRAGRDSLRLGDSASVNPSMTGDKTLYLYDRLGRVVSRRPHYVSAATPKDSTVYDAAGNVVKTITRRGDTITTSVDSRNRATHVAIPGVGTLRKTFGGPQDQVTRVWYDAPVDSLGGVNGEVRYGYDQSGRLKADTVYTGSIPRVRTYTYDHYERDSITTSPLGTWEVFYEETLGYVNQVVSPFVDTVQYFRDEVGRLERVIIRNPGARQFVDAQFDEVGRLTSMDHSVVGHFTGGRYDRVGGTSDPGVGPDLGPTWTEWNGAASQTDSIVDSLAYDGWERLTWWKQTKNGSHVGLTKEYTFDRSGNIHTPGGYESYSSATNRLTMRKAPGIMTYTYDDAGNLTERYENTHTWVYGYDALNRLTSVRRDGTLIARYGYDVLGRRIAKRVYSAASGGTVGYTRFVYAGSHVSFETDSAGTIGLKYVWGAGTDNLLAVRDANDSTFYAVTDKLGSVRGLVRRDGTWIGTLRYDPYGTAIDSVGSAMGLRYRWTGREWDAETGFYFHRARYYDPGAKRFITEDPIGYAGAMNLYAYVDGAPLEATDPSGLLKSWTDDGRGFMAMCTMHGSLLNANGSITTGGCAAHLGYNQGGGGTWRSRGMIDNDNNGIDDFDAFSDYSFAKQQWDNMNPVANEDERMVLNDQWLALQFALDHAGLSPEDRITAQQALVFGRVFATDFGEHDPTPGYTTANGYISLNTNWFYSHFVDGGSILANTYLHEFFHLAIDLPTNGGFLRSTEKEDCRWQVRAETYAAARTGYTDPYNKRTATTLVYRAWQRC